MGALEPKGATTIAAMSEDAPPKAVYRTTPLRHPLPFDCPACGRTMRVAAIPVLPGLYTRLVNDQEVVPMSSVMPCPKCHHPIRLFLVMTVVAERVEPPPRVRPHLLRPPE